MLSLLQVQTIIAQCIREITSGNQTYSRNKTFAQMSLLSQVRVNGFVYHVYTNRASGLPYYHHDLPDDALDGLTPDSKLSTAEDILLTASPLPGRVINPLP